jgi:hypothetical protein
MNPGRADIVLINDSHLSVTGYSVAIDIVGKSGQSNRSYKLAALDPDPNSFTGLWKSNTTVTIPVMLDQNYSLRVAHDTNSGLVADPVVSVKAKVLMAIYEDGTAEAYNKEGEDQLTEEIERRKSMELAFQRSVQILEEALANHSDPHPASTAAAKIHSELLQADLARPRTGVPALNNAGKPDPAYLSDLPGELMVPAGVDERQQVMALLKERKKKAIEYAPFARITRRLP